MMDRSRLEFRWLRRLLAATALLWLLWICYVAADYFVYNGQLGVHVYYPFYIFFVVIIIWTGAAAFLQPQAAAQVQNPPTARQPVPYELREKGTGLKRAMDVHRYYEDPELSLASLAAKLNLHPHELSRIVNTALKKNFNDFINEYRVRDVILKMRNPAYSNITLLGIAFEAGFNSKATFNRAFKQITGKSAAEWKDNLENEASTYHLTRPSHFTTVISTQKTTPKWAEVKLTRYFMFRNYVKIAWRNLLRNKVLSFLNISGLSVGMAVAMLTALWIWDELSFNTYHKNYSNIARVLLNETQNGDISTMFGLPAGLGAELRKSYGSDFKYVVMSSFQNRHVISAGEKKVSSVGSFMDADAPELFTLEITEGTGNNLADPSSILLSLSLAKSIFGNAACIGKLVTLDNEKSFKVTGVYKDPPANTSLYLNNISFIGPWSYYAANVLPTWVWDAWGWDCAQLFVQTTGNADMAQVSAKIKNAVFNKANSGDQKPKPALLLYPMSKWHLYQYKNGVMVWGKMQYVWLFGMVGIFVLLLACINFMNLSTARSEKRAKEVGIRKAVGSLKGQLIKQFFCESVLIAMLSFMLSLLLVMAVLPWFNSVSNKQVSVLWAEPLFWLATLGFTLFTGIVAGSYPAFYLSSFNPVKVLKGTFKAGPFAAVPRKVLLVVQFTVSIVLIVATIVVFKQIEFAENRPVGYSKDGLVNIALVNNDLHKQFNAFRNGLLQSGTVAEAAESTEPVTGNGNNAGGLQWAGKDPGMADNFGIVSVTPGYGKTVGWQFVAGRDFSTQLLSDSTGLILNEAAVAYMGFKKPIGERVTIAGSNINYTVIGVVKNMVMNSPYEPVKQTIFNINKNGGGTLNIKINPNVSAHLALTKIEAAFKTYSPSMPFSYKFADEEYAKKFESEEQVGKLVRFFAALAIFISCLGLFGMVSFMAEQRVKEIGVRKVLGASVFGLWRLMSGDFVIMVIISLFVAIPVAWWAMYNWLQNFTYRTGLSWWVFVVAGLGAMAVTLLTISYQSIKAALANPVRSLRSE
jgi:ABC-type antimicrobial peptide transport system permease subunit/AraC-like DNA-binding protein